MLHIKLTNTSGYSKDMERHYQKLVEAGWGADVSKETRTIEGARPGWVIEETDYYIDMALSRIFDLSEVLDEELILYKENGRPVIEIYDDWRE